MNTEKRGLDYGGCNDGPNDPKLYDTLSEEQKVKLQAWISICMKKTKTPDPFRTSYGLKHDFERSPILGFYVENGIFKGAMLAANYQPVKAEERNWVFCARMRK